MIALLSPYHEFLYKRGIDLPPAGTAKDLDLEKLVHIFMTPDDSAARMPLELVDALYVLDEIGTPAGMDAILERAAELGIALSHTVDQAPMDVAVEAWLVDRDLVLNAHAEQYLDHPRSFEYFPRAAKARCPYRLPSKTTLKAIEHDLDNWFEKHRRGRTARVFMFPRGTSTWFLIRHGQPLRREGSLDNGQPSSVVYRPERFDVLVYDHDLDELRINAQSKGEKVLYREVLGKHLLGDSAYFGNAAKYTLDPIRVQKNNCLNCEDIAGLEKIKLCEIQFLWGGAENETEIRKASDVFEAYAARKREFPSIPKIIKARFEVKFSDSKTTRKVTVSGHNTQCVRDSDTGLIENWLSARGFATGAEPVDGKVKALSELLGDSGGAAGNDGKLGGLGTAPGDGIFIDVPAAAKDRKTGQRATRAGTASE